ncbi:serine hydroxymethyltransferase [Candidatus Parcubacteria bacterium 4484_255]|nr:MAG: serine hydroxymethyltransferase [Candidatus Parcubacteria bacterium 4484_255]
MEINNVDPQIAKLISQEKKRQEKGLILIPSENFVSLAVLEALGSICTNKYAEGYPNKRYYSGNKYIDKIETIARERAKKIFHAQHANVQPYSGSPANLAVYLALAQPGDTIMGMSLAQGGHLTHGHKVNISGKLFNFIQYGVDKKTYLINYSEIEKLAEKYRPKIIISGATAYPRIIKFKKIHQIARKIGAISMADISHIAGLIIAKCHPSPLPFTDVVTTTTHKTLRGPRGAIIMCKKKYASAIDKMVFPGMQGGPHENNIAGIAVALKEASRPDFKKYSQQIVKNAKTLAQALKNKGLNLVSGNTDNHLILIDLTDAGITGKQAENALEKVGIYVNKNMIPYDTRSPFNPSGIRLGAPALTTRGFKEREMKIIGELISQVIYNFNNQKILNKVKEKVKELTYSHVIKR